MVRDSQPQTISLILQGQRGTNDFLVPNPGLSQASAKVVRHSLTGPKPGGAPFFAILSVEGGVSYEQLLVNSLGPVELWALSTTPGDTALRSRVYAAVGFGEGLRRLSIVFPRGSALKEIERRTKARLKKGDVADRVEASVVDGLAGELVRGHGLGIVLRPDGQAANDSFQVAAE